MKTKSFWVWGYLFGLGWRLLVPITAWAAPYYTVSGTNTLYYLQENQYNVFLHTTTEILTAAHGELYFDDDLLEPIAYSAVGSKCNFWSPADPALGYGNNGTPYIFSGDRLVFSCGFSNPGYTSTSELGDLMLSIKFRSKFGQQGATQLTFDNTQFRYVGSLLASGTSEAFDLTVYAASITATPTQVPTPTADPADVLELSELNFVDISTKKYSLTPRPTSAITSLNDYGELIGAANLDNTIPFPPDMTPRPTLTPYVGPTLRTNQESSGNVLSFQSLRELLIPGKSEADKTVVMVNLLSLLAFVIILVMLIWRLMTLRRLNKLRQKHLKEIIEGELSVIEAKISGQPEPAKTLAEHLLELRKRLNKEG